ncbi:MAG TPA: MFS transporter [Prolixibacteraceae bacterium]|nr:MFS transporter [Prolixibacteraceae bacterium]
MTFARNKQFRKFCAYGFLKNLLFFEPFLILFLRDAGLSYTQIGLLVSFQLITQNILEIPAGILADSMGRRRTLMASFAFYIAAFIFFFFSYGLLGFIIAMFLFALGEALRTGTHKAMIFDYLKLNGWQSEKVAYYGITRAWSQRGSALSALLAAFFVIATRDYRMIFIISVIPYLADLILVASYPSALDGSKTGFHLAEIKDNYYRNLKEFFYSFKKPGLLKTTINNAIFSGYYKAVKDFLQPILAALALSLPVMIGYSDEQRSALVVGVVYFFIYQATSYASRKSSAFSKKIVNLQQALSISLWTGLLAGIISGITYYAGYPALAVAFYIIIYLIENLRKPIAISETANQLDTDILATVLSTASQFETLFAALLSAMLGVFADHFGLGIAIASVSVFVLITAPLFIVRHSAKNQSLSKF